MKNPKYQAIIRAATETRNIDFKGPMNWRTATKCEKFEVLKDIAAMANAGGGHLVIGRDAPAHTTGTLTTDQTRSFDPTEVNKVVHKYLAPTLECRVEPEEFGTDILVIIEIPEFDTTPLIFQSDGQCADASCKKSPHFRLADIYVRTKAQQSQRVQTAEEMRDIVSRSVRKTSTALVTEIQRMLASPQSVEEPLPTSSYDAEYEHEEREFFGPMFYPRVPHAGHFDMTVRPAVYRADRVELNWTPRKIVEYNFAVLRNGIFDAVPFEGDHDQQKFADGARLRMEMPKWRKCEGVSLHTSGLYRIVRSFMEDFQPSPDGTSVTFVEKDRTLMIDLFVEQMTMLHLLARNVARDLLADPDEELQIDIRVDGLAGRTLSANQVEPLEQFLIGLPGQPGTENVFSFPLRTTRRSLEIDAVRNARSQCQRILWTFGIDKGHALTFQRRLLSRTEDALPPTES